MSCDPPQNGLAISTRDVGKCYHIYERPQDRLKQALWRGRKQFYRDFWALRGISLDVRRGETIGIIGRNGSGKSTLLQIVAGTLVPSEGEARVNGRVAALLELGSGFNPDFTGRENVYMNGAILGLSRAEIEARLDDIVGFADIGDFVDQPVKTYSSGMVVRLAFAVSVHVDAQVLIVDEALAVGDAPFQAKCFRHIDRLRQQGVTILLATHDTVTVSSMCDRALLLERGEAVAWGPGKEVAEEYYRRVRDLEMQRGAPAAIATSPHPAAENGEDGWAAPDASRATRMGDGRAEITAYAVYNHHRRPTRALSVRERFRVDVCVQFRAPLENPHVGAAVRDVQGRLLLGGHTMYEGIRLGPVQAGQTVTVSFEMQMNLNPGKYLLMIGVAEHEDFANWRDCDVLFDLCEIEVYGKDRAWSLVDSPVRIITRNGTADAD